MWLLLLLLPYQICVMSHLRNVPFLQHMTITITSTSCTPTPLMCNQPCGTTSSPLAKPYPFKYQRNLHCSAHISAVLLNSMNDCKLVKEMHFCTASLHPNKPGKSDQKSGLGVCLGGCLLHSRME